MKKKGSRRRLLVWALLVIYLGIVLYLTLFSREPENHRKLLRPFWEYHEMLYGSDRLYSFQQIACNILMLAPLGAFLKVMFRKRSVLLAGGIGLLFSCWIELTQYFTKRGLMELDDVFNNTLGAAIGYAVASGVLGYLKKRKPPKSAE